MGSFAIIMSLISRSFARNIHDVIFRGATLVYDDAINRDKLQTFSVND